MRGNPNLAGPERALSPAQEDLVARVRKMDAGRILVRWPVGSGLSTALVAACRSLRMSRPSSRILIITPTRALADQWTRRLADDGLEFSFIQGKEYRRLEADTPAAENPLAAVPLLVTTLGFASLSDRAASLVDAHWDLVVVDEVHQVGAGTPRAEFLRLLWASGGVGTMLLASPVGFDHVDFDVWKSADSSPERWEFGAEFTVPSPWPVTLHTAVVTAPEQAVLEAARETFAPDPGASTQANLIRRSLLGRAASSLYALDLSARAQLTAPDVRVSVPDNEGGEEPVDELRIDAEPAPMVEDIDSRALATLVDLLDRVTVDSKADLLADVLQGLVVRGQVVVFTDFADTVRYLAEDLRARGLKVATLVVASSPEERVVALHQIAGNEGVLIASSAAVQGLEFGPNAIVVHYDLPRTPAGMTVRMSRTWRIGRPMPVSHVIVDEVLFDSRQLAHLGIEIDGGHAQS